MAWPLPTKTPPQPAPEPAIPPELKALRAQLEQELRPLVEAELRPLMDAEVERRLEDMRQRELDHHQEALAAYQHDTENDLESRAERKEAEIRHAVRDEFEQRLSTARTAASEWQQRAEAAEAALLGLLAELLPLDKRRNLGRHVSIKQMDLVELNAVVQRHRQRVHATATDSAFGVECHTAHGPRTLHVFWRTEGQDDSH